MKMKLLSLVLTAALILTVLSGCSTVSDIAGNVAQAAMAELENQVKAALEKHKVDVIEIKTAHGKLNDEGSDLQFYCAALVSSDSDAVPKACAEGMNHLFEEAGVQVQTESKITSPHLVHKELSFDFSSFGSDTTYYIIYVYSSDMTIQLPDITLPTIASTGS